MFTPRPEATFQHPYVVDANSFQCQSGSCAHRLADLWCRLIHPAPMWPVHGYYRCSACRRQYPVPWEGRPLAVGMEAGTPLLRSQVRQMTGERIVRPVHSPGEPAGCTPYGGTEAISDTIRELIEEHYAYYTTKCCHTTLSSRKGTVRRTRLHVGFRLALMSTSTAQESKMTRRGSPIITSLATELQKIAKKSSHHSSDTCSIEAIPSFSSILFDAGKNLQPQAMMRIRVSHHRGLNQPAGPAEEHALGQIEKQLQEIRFT